MPRAWLAQGRVLESHQIKDMEAWWYTCSREICCHLPFKSIMICDPTNQQILITLKRSVHDSLLWTAACDVNISAQAGPWHTGRIDMSC